MLTNQIVNYTSFLMKLFETRETIEEKDVIWPVYEFPV